MCMLLRSYYVHLCSYACACNYCNKQQSFHGTNYKPLRLLWNFNKAQKFSLPSFWANAYHVAILSMQLHNKSKRMKVSSYILVKYMKLRKFCTEKHLLLMTQYVHVCECASTCTTIITHICTYTHAHVGMHIATYVV